MIDRRAVAKQLAILPLAGLLPAASDTPKQPIVDRPAPDFTIRLIDNSTVRLSELRGQVVVLNFWATWCAPCKKELPLLDQYYRLTRKHGMHVYAITTEGSLPLYKLKPLFAAMEIHSARSIKGPYAPIGGSVPTNFVIDRAGVLRYAKAGAFDLDDLNRILIPLLQDRS